MRSRYSDSLVGYKPSVSSVPDISCPSFPPFNIRFILVFNSYSQLIDFYGSAFCKMKYILMTVVKVALAVNRLKMADGNAANHVGIVSNILDGNSDRLYPVYRVLQF